MHLFSQLIKLNKRALLYGSVTCVIIWLAYTFILNAISNNTHINQYSNFSWLVVYVLTPINLAISGYIAGRIACHNGFLHGVIIGLVSSLVIMLGYVIVFDQNTLFLNIEKLIAFHGMIISGSGGVVGERWPKRQGVTASNN